MGGMNANRASNKAAADRMLRHWADLLIKHLGDVQGSAAAD